VKCVEETIKRQSRAREGQETIRTGDGTLIQLDRGFLISIGKIAGHQVVVTP
jgi:hypothetical protein